MAANNVVISEDQGVTVASLKSASLLDGPVIEDIGKTLYELVDEKDRKKLIVDFRKVSFLSSSMIGVMVNLHKKALAIDGTVVLTGMKPNLQKVFKVTGLHKLLNFADDEQHAMKKFKWSAGA